jgi:hypothetical protein
MWDAGEVDESEEVFDVVFPSGDEAVEVVHPGEGLSNPRVANLIVPPFPQQAPLGSLAEHGRSLHSFRSATPNSHRHKPVVAGFIAQC